MPEYFHRIVFCSERKKRCRRDEITVSSTDMMVTRVEEMPPHYDIAMEGFRKQGEAMQFTRGGLRYWSGYRGCPFCGNIEVTFCNVCQRYSCWNQQKKISVCGWCEAMGEPVLNPHLPLSESGLVHDRERIAGSGGRRGVDDREQRKVVPPSPDKAADRKRLEDYFETGTVQKQLPGGGDKPQLPDFSGKFLPAPEEDKGGGGSSMLDDIRRMIEDQSKKKGK